MFSATNNRLLAVLLPVVAAMLLVWSLLDLTLGAGRLVIVDGVAEALEADVLAWAKLATAVVCWLIGLVAGGWAVTHEDGPVKALVQGVKFLPVFLAALAATVGCFYVALSVLEGVLLYLTLAMLACLAVRAAFTGMAWTIGEFSGRPPVLSMLAWAAIPVLLAVGRGRLHLGLLSALLDALLLIVVLGVQVHLATPGKRAGGSARLWPGIAMVAVAVLVAAGMIIINPYAAPATRTHRGVGDSVAVGWPAGQSPVIVTTGGVLFCDDDLCDDFTDVSGGPSTIDGYGTAAIGVDGTVVKTAVTGGPDKGGPFVQYARCVREGCRQAWLPVRTSAREKLDLQGRVEAAGAAAPDGALWLFVASPTAGGKYGRFRFQLIRCADVTCASPQRHDVGTTDRTPADGYPPGRRARLSIGLDGRPSAAFWNGWSILRYTCDPVTCAGPREFTSPAAAPDAVWDGDVSFREDGRLRRGEDTTGILDRVAGAGTGGLTMAGSDVYVGAALPSVAGDGFRLTLGKPATYWRQTVWRCRGFTCASAPMDVYEGRTRRSLLAVAGDGRVVVVRGDRIALLEAPIP